MKKALPLQKARADFPMLQKEMSGKPLVYLDSAATTLKPECVVDALSEFYLDEYATVHRGVYELATKATEKYGNVRSQIQQFINAASEEEIVFTQGTTDGINLVAQTYGRSFLEPGDEVIISVMEHHSNIVPWQMLCQEKRAHLKAIPINDKGELILEEYRSLLSNRTKIVAIAHIANATGTLNPIDEIVSLAREKGAAVLIDGAQAAAHFPIDVRALDVDFYAFSGHKLYGPTGIGVLYGKKHLLERMPPYKGGGDMIKQVSIEKSSYQRPPLKFEAGTPSIAQVIALGKALEYVESIGRDAISHLEMQLLQSATEKISEIEGVRLIGSAEKKGAILSFTVDGLHALDVGTLLSSQGIALRTGHLCAQPTLKHFGVSSLIRASFGLYNDMSDVDRFISRLRHVITTLSALV